MLKNSTMQSPKLFGYSKVWFVDFQILIAVSLIGFSCKSDTNIINDSKENPKQTIPAHVLREELWPEGGLTSWERRILFGDVLVVQGRIAVTPGLSGPFDFRLVGGLNSIVHVRQGTIRASKLLYCDAYTVVDRRTEAIEDGPVEFPCFSKVQMSEGSISPVEITLQKLEEHDKGVFVIAFDEFIVSYELIKVIDEDSKERLVQLLEKKIANQQRWNTHGSKLDFREL
jgi:hypothetical protein